MERERGDKEVMKGTEYECANGKSLVLIKNTGPIREQTTRLKTHTHTP